jgi:CheY-like chemotaxis protein
MFNLLKKSFFLLAITCILSTNLTFAASLAPKQTSDLVPKTTEVKAKEHKRSTSSLELSLCTQSLSKPSLLTSSPLTAPPSSSPTPTKGPKFLVVDDLLVLRKMAKRQLEILYPGCIIEIAENGVQAVEQVEKSPEPFDLILMDREMPKMDGPTATVKIRKNGCVSPILGYTSTTDIKTAREICLSAGMNEVLPKPAPLNDLKAAIDFLMRDTSPTSPLSPTQNTTPPPPLLLSTTPKTGCITPVPLRSPKSK